MCVGGGKQRPPSPSLVSVPGHIISSPHPHPSSIAPHSIYPHLSKMKNPSFSSNVQPNIIYTPFPKIESYLGATGFAICFQISFLHELYFPSTLDKIITRSIHFSGHQPSTYIFLARFPHGAGQFSVSRPQEHAQKRGPWLTET